jgi:ABC-2 type transport system permease protein
MKITAFIKKDLLIMVSYRFRIILQFGGIVFSLLFFYFLSRTFKGAMSPFMSQYGGEYFPYVLIGIAVSSFVNVGLSSLAGEVRAAQVEGTMEALLSTPTSIYTILFGSSVWSFLEAFTGTVLLIIFGIIYVGLKITIFQAIMGILILGLTTVAFIAVGMLSASFIMIFKQGNPIGTLFGMSGYFLGGVIFPVEVLPLPLQYASKFLPITYAIKALRELFLAGSPVKEILPVFGYLFIFIILFLPASIIAFRYAVNRAKKNGSLIQY